ncbi:MAG: ATP-binding cassette domain-containing protein [Chloroflexi bacterium]|nr:ATP-binding cassette domain-containing protein [Chloroflexota bacterium]
MTDALVQIEKLSYQYPSSPEAALRDISLGIPRGQFVGLIGPTGAGKTTLCLTLNGVVPQFHGGRFFGSARVAGMDTLEQPISALARHVGMVFQDPESQILSTSLENEVAFALENARLPREEIRQRVAEALAFVRLEGLEKKRPHELSGGQKQRLAIAAALALRPELLVLDEPTSQLDPVGQDEIFATVARLNREMGITVLLASHAAEALAEYAERVLLLEDGRLADDGPPAEVFQRVPSLLASGLRPPQVTIFYHLMARAGARLAQVPTTLPDALAAYHTLRQQFRPRPLPAPAPAPPTATAPPLLEVRDLAHTYPDGTEALRGVNLSIHAGEYVVIVGKTAQARAPW